MIHRLSHLLVFLMLSLMAGAQGVVVYQKDGTSIKVPYEQLDSIATFDYETSANKSITVGSHTFNMIFVSAGSYVMGASEEQADPYEDELPAHEVKITKDFYILETEVTQGLWRTVMGNSPTASGPAWTSGYGLGSTYPAYYVNYSDVQSFITTLNKFTGLTFRLPTEAEWEFAARGGNRSQGYQYSGSNAIGDVAWYSLNSDTTTHKVKTMSPNELGLYDMSGNVWEWCSDWYDENYYEYSPSKNPTGPATGTYRVFRGGVWFSASRFCRNAFRSAGYPKDRSPYVGFRIAMSVK